MSNRFGFWIAHLNILVVCGVLAGAFVVQFGEGSYPVRSVCSNAWL